MLVGECAIKPYGVREGPDWPQTIWTLPGSTNWMQSGLVGQRSSPAIPSSSLKQQTKEKLEVCQVSVEELNTIIAPTCHGRGPKAAHLPRSRSVQGDRPQVAPWSAGKPADRRTIWKHSGIIFGFVTATGRPWSHSVRTAVTLMC